MSEEYEYVRASQRQSAYVRKTPYTRQHPSLYQRKARYWFGRLAHDATDETGLHECGDKEVPPAAMRVTERMKGMKFTPSKPKDIRQTLLEMVTALGDLGHQVAINRHIMPRLVLWQRQHEKLEEEKRKVKAPI